jgi:hypothetical protein
MQHSLRNQSQMARTLLLDKDQNKGVFPSKHHICIRKSSSILERRKFVKLYRRFRYYMNAHVELERVPYSISPVKLFHTHYIGDCLQTRVGLNVTAKIRNSLTGIEGWISAVVSDFIGWTILAHQLCYSFMHVSETLLKLKDQAVFKNTRIPMQTVELMLTEIVYEVPTNTF